MSHQSEVLIIGAGVSGLLAGKILSQNGIAVMILEKSRRVGGRMATRRFKQGVFDHGAQFFTVREPQFQSWVDQWMQEGVVQEWAHGFSKSGDSPNNYGNPRYMGVNGMTSIAKELSWDLDIQLQTPVESIATNGKIWIAQTKDGRELSANQLILTAPVPQSLNLLMKGNIFLSKREFDALQTIQYHPCVALLVLLDGHSRVPAPGGLKFDSGPIQWLGDNNQKGISPKTTAVTIHASPGFSRTKFELPAEELAESLIMAGEPWLGQDIQDWQIHKWRYSQPAHFYPEQFLVVPGYRGLFMIGDAFGGARVEGAALSGIGVASHLREKF